MDIRTLQYFLTIAKEESITKAAEVLHMTQPPLSRQMKELEEELGKQLFIRGSKKITLTEDGLLLMKRAEEMTALMEKTISELSSDTRQIAGDILIGAAEISSFSFLTDIANKLSKNYPDIHYKIYSGDASLVKDNLSNGLIDFGVLVGQVDIENYEYIRLPKEESWGVIMRKDCPLATKEFITPYDLADSPLILSHQAVNNSEILNWLKTGCDNPRIIATYNLAYNASLFVKSGMGIMLGLKHIVNTSTESELIFKELQPSMNATVNIIWKKNQRFGAAANLFLSEIRNFI